MFAESDSPYRSRLTVCDLCERLRERSRVGPTLTYDPESKTYTAVVRCRDRADCERETAALNLGVAKVR